MGAWGARPLSVPCRPALCHKLEIQRRPPTSPCRPSLSPQAPLNPRRFALHPHPSPAADGPFVMNHELEIQQAFSDYLSGQLQRKDDNPWKDDEEL